jgi:hypothetical protein
MSRLRERRGRRRRQGAKQPVDFGLCSDAAPAVDAGSLDGKSRDDLPSVSPPFGTSHKPKDAVRERFFRTESPPKMAPVRRAFGVHLQRFANLVVADPRRSAEARLVIKPVHTDAGKTLAPHACGMRAIGGDFLVGQPIRLGQNDALARPRPRRASLRIRAVNPRRSESKTISTARPSAILASFAYRRECN